MVNRIMPAPNERFHASGGQRGGQGTRNQNVSRRNLTQYKVNF